MKTLRESTAGCFNTKEEVLSSFCVHNFTKQIIRLAGEHDLVDAYHDIRLALAVIENDIRNLE